MNVWTRFISHVAEGRFNIHPGDVELLATSEIYGNDATGAEGFYVATFGQILNPSPQTMVEFGVPAENHIFCINADYTIWKEHERLRVLSFGIIEDDPATAPPRALPYLIAGANLYFLPFRQCVFHKGSKSYSEIRWHEDKKHTSFHFTQPSEKFDDLRDGWNALREFEGIQAPKRGPAPGTAWNQTYRSREEWHAALLGTVQAKPIQTQVITQIADILAGRLGMGATTVRRNLKRWGPKTPEELRNGKWDCACHSCRS